MTDDELTTETPAMHHLKSAQFSHADRLAKPREPACLQPGSALEASAPSLALGRCIGELARHRPLCRCGGEEPIELWAELVERKKERNYHGRHHHDGIWLTTSYVSVTDFWSSHTCGVLINDHNMSHDSIA